MNAFDSATLPARAADTGLPNRALADQAVRLVRRLTLASAGAVLAILVMTRSAAWLPAIPLAAASQPAGLIPLALASLLLALAGLGGTWIMARARRLAASAPVARDSGWRRWLPAPPCGDPGAIGRAARWPQAILVGALALAAAISVWMLPAGPQGGGLALGCAAIVLAFPMLIAERVLAATPPAVLPEAPALRALVLLPMLAWAAAGLLQIAAALRVPYTGWLGVALGLVLTAVAAELLLRALGRCFLPPPAPATARAAVESTLAGVIADGVRTRSLAAPVRQHLGIDFSRSWALAYVRDATPSVVLLLLLLCWGLSGAVLVNLNQRAVYQRFGEPVAVLQPGLHLILPWPMGQVRRVEFGTIHEMTLSGSDIARPATVAAEALPPPEADRLWEQAHPAELVFLIASATAGRQSFQVVSADIKLRYRTGLTDRDALLAATGVVNPADLLRAAAGRVIARFFAARTLDAVLGENREAMAEHLRAAVQQDLDRIGSGIELAAVVVEAIHPPAGAAEAYHNVQAAEILANTSISAERGHALASAATAHQNATDMEAKATAAAAETVGGATADLTRFTADKAAATAGGKAFLLERRLASISDGLARIPLTIIDHRIAPTDAPMLDLRPQPAAPGAPSAAPGLE
jgi:regulator of protease activity HflC (stomatin/prohibitin superfamily)